jgi:hypothetical protein
MQLARPQLERLLALGREARRRLVWRPIPDRDGVQHPQRMAYESVADIIGYGGAAGGGKTDLACGKAITAHRKIAILRRVGTEMQGIEDRLEDLIGKDGFNGQKKIWKRRRADGEKQQIELGSLPNLGDERGWQGRPHDLLVFDEAANFLEAQVRFLMGWCRTTVRGQRAQVLMTFNPPTSAEGQWILAFFAPWLDPRFPDPALPGELRWCAVVNGKDVWVPDSRRFVVGEEGERLYDFDPKAHASTAIITPRSRTFIPSRVTDNPHLLETGYMSTLQALPEPLRSQMLNGDFRAGMTDDPWQVVPTAWVEASMALWSKPTPMPEMDAMGVDVARGGKDETVIARRHGLWLDELLAYPGKETPDGHDVAGLVVARLRNQAPIHIDVIGVGASPYDILRQNHQIIGVNVSEKSHGTDRSGRLRFMNQRSELWWRVREALDPENPNRIILPNDSKLLADLTAPKWRLQGPIIAVESREDIVDRIGRSPDRASALILALIDTPKAANLRAAYGGARVADGGGDYDPYSGIR